MRRVLTLAAGLLTMALTASAQQPQTMEVVIQQQQRQGSFMSGSKLLDASIVGPLVTFRADINAADYVDPANSLWMRVYFSNDNGITWSKPGGALWKGGPFIDEDGNVNPMPTYSFGLNAVRGQLVRVEVDVPQRMRVGATIIY